MEREIDFKALAHAIWRLTVQYLEHRLAGWRPREEGQTARRILSSPGKSFFFFFSKAFN